MEIKKITDEQDAYSNAVYSSSICMTMEIKCDKGTYLFKNIHIDEENIIKMNAYQRLFLGLDVDDKVTSSYSTTSSYTDGMDIVHFIIKSNNGFKVTIDEELFIEKLYVELKDIPMQHGMEYCILCDGHSIVLECTTHSTKHFITNDTDITVSANHTVELLLQPSILISNYKEMSKNIGGMKKELMQIFTRVFSTRLIDEDVCDEMNIKHVKGIILHGPPGCGKTLVARELTDIMGCNDVTYVAGPELISSYQGKSEENVRKLFSKAKKYPDKLSVVICDECDAIFKKRNEGTNSGTANNITNQFLSMMDGVDGINNIMLICMTNRLELIDKAILRPGRIELQIKIELPELQDRIEIFNIHFNKINEKYKDILDITNYATLTNNFTGAEIESVVTNAKSKAISRILNLDDLEDVESDKIKITNIDVLYSIAECVPYHGSSDTILKKYKDDSFILIHEFIQDIYMYISGHASVNKNNVTSLVICYVNNDYMLRTLCNITEKFPESTIYHITLNMVLEDDLQSILDRVADCKDSIIILENIEHILYYNPLINNCDTHILQIVNALIFQHTRNKIKVFITSRNEKLMKCLFPNTEIRSMGY